MKIFAELDVVQLQKAHPECGLATGAKGTVVMVHAQGEAYEVEFLSPNGFTLAVLTLPAAEVAAVSQQPMRHAA